MFFIAIKKMQSRKKNWNTSAMNKSKEANGSGHLYVVHTRQCIDNGLQVYKVGRAKDANRRLKQYPKGGELVTKLLVSNMAQSKAVCLALCRGSFISRKDFGSDYFEVTEVTLILEMLIKAARMFPHVSKAASHG